MANLVTGGGREGAHLDTAPATEGVAFGDTLFKRPVASQAATSRLETGAPGGSVKMRPADRTSEKRPLVRLMTGQAGWEFASKGVRGSRSENPRAGLCHRRLGSRRWVTVTSGRGAGWR